MRILSILIYSTFLSFSCNSQSPAVKKDATKEIKVGGSCEGCEAIYESPVPLENLKPTAYLPHWGEEGAKLEISGIVYQPDGITPAAGVVLYIYHTDQQGIYPKKGTEKGWAKRHGYLRGWMRTNEKGEYRFYTLLPASYPNSTIPAHIHITIKESGKTEYYIDEYLFDDDPLLTTTERKNQPGRGGNGIISTEKKDGIQVGERDIYLGRNIPGYPIPVATGLQSGLRPGDNCPAFEPLHFSGADKGKRLCPMCKYGFGEGIMIWFNHTNLEQMDAFTIRLENEMQKRGVKSFRVFLVYMHPDKKAAQQTISNWVDKLLLKNVAVLQVPSPADPGTSGLYEINTEAKNTVFVYKKRKVAAKWVDIDYSNESLNRILQLFKTNPGSSLEEIQKGTLSSKP